MVRVHPGRQLSSFASSSADDTLSGVNYPLVWLPLSSLSENSLT